MNRNIWISAKAIVEFDFPNSGDIWGLKNSSRRYIFITHIGLDGLFCDFVPFLDVQRARRMTRDEYIAQIQEKMKPGSKRLNAARESLTIQEIWKYYELLAPYKGEKNETTSKI